MQTSEGLKAPDMGITQTAIFPSLFIQLATPSSVLPRSVLGFKSVPYDAYCPSLQAVVGRRVCKKCGLYHASIVSLKSHQRVCGVEDAIPTLRVRPVRVAARRQRELMAVIAFQEHEDVEWIDEEFVDTAGMTVPADSVNKRQSIPNPIINTADHLAVPWTDE